MAQQQYGSQESTSQEPGSTDPQHSWTSHQPREYGSQAGGQPSQPGQGEPAARSGQAGGMGQPGGQMQPSAGGGLKLEEAISNEMRVVLHDFVQAVNVCEWCAERCIDAGPQMAECVRLCRDVADIASLNVQLLARDSVFGPELAEVFARAAEACAQECAKHPERHCQECAEVLPRAARSTREMLSAFGGGQRTELEQPQFGSRTAGQF